MPNLLTLVKKLGYHGLYDEEGSYESPQILVFQPTDLIWGSRKLNSNFYKLITAFLSQVKAKYSC